MHTAFRAWALAQTDRVTVLYYHDVKIQATNETLDIPALMIYRQFLNFKHKEQAACQRENIYKRDKFICQYCGNRFKREDLTVDHVMPKSRGGPWSWDNLVTCCKRCNGKKDDRTPKEAGMKLLTKPYAPLRIAMDEPKIGYSGVFHDSWSDYMVKHGS